MIHRSCENFPFLTTENRFDVHLTDKMTYLDARFIIQLAKKFLAKMIVKNNFDARQSYASAEIPVAVLLSLGAAVIIKP